MDESAEPRRFELRRKLFGGLRSDDVAGALAALNGELVAARGREAELQTQLDAANEGLEGFRTALGHVETLLELADERARQIERGAEAEAARTRERAQARVDAAQRELDGVLDGKRETVDALERVREGIAELLKGLEAADGGSVHQFPQSS